MVYARRLKATRAIRFFYKGKWIVGRVLGEFMSGDGGEYILIVRDSQHVYTVVECGAFPFDPSDPEDVALLEALNNGR